MAKKNRPLTILRRASAATVCAALIITAPGLGAYEAFANVLRAPVLAGPSAGTGSIGAVGGAVSDIGGISNPALASMGATGLAPLLPSLSLDAPDLSPASAIQGKTPVAAAGVKAARRLGASHAPALTPAEDLPGQAQERGPAKAAVSAQTRLSGIAKLSSRLGADAAKAPAAGIKADADFTAPRIGKAADFSAPAVKGAFSPLRSRLFRSGQVQGRSYAEPEAPKQEESGAEGENLVFDIHKGYFKAGYLAASLWEQDTSIELPKTTKTLGRTSSKERIQFIQGLAYRIAELAKNESAARSFMAKAKGASDAEIGTLLDDILAGYDTAHPALRADLQDADFVQGYLTGMEWRPGKQLMMPAPSLRDRFSFGLRKKMKARDEKFMEGLYASLEGREGSPAASIKEKLADGPVVGSRDFGTRLGYVLSEVMEPLYDKVLDEKLPYLPGKIEIPRSLKGLVLGHTVFIMFGIYMHISAQPYLVYGLTGSKTMMGVIRNVHFGAYSASSFLPIGPAIDKTDFKTMFIWTSVARAMLMGLIPLLFFNGYMTFAVLIGIVALNPMFQSLMTNSDTASRDSFLGRDENVVREGTAFGTKVSAVSGLVIPAAAAWVVSQLVVAFGNPGGYAMAYAGYAVMLLASIPIFMLMIRDPRYYDPSVQVTPSKNPLNIFMPLWTVVKIPYIGLKWLVGKIRKLRGRKDAEVSALDQQVLEEAGTREVPFEKGRRVKNLREKMARFFDKIEATQGVSVILRSDTLSLLVAITAIELFIADALMFVVIPNYIIDVIRPTAALASVPVIGSMLTTPVGIMGLMLTAGAVGRYLGSRWASGPKGARRIKKWGHKALYRGAAISGLTFWAMLIPTFFVAPAGAAGAAAMSIPLFAGSMAVLLAFEFFLSMLATPLGIAMAPVRRKQIPNHMVGKVSAAFTMVDVGLMALGALVVGILIDIVPIQTAIAIIATAVTMTSILEWFAPGWLKKINPEGWENGQSKRKDPKKS